MTAYSQRQYDGEFARGEALWRGGHFAEALEGFAGALGRRLAALAAGEAEPAGPFAGDLVVIERVADAAAVMGNAQAADDMLAAYAGLARAHGNHLASDYAALKRAHLALERGLPSEAERLLRGMGPSVGDIEDIEFTPAGLDEWEAGRGWHAAGRAVMFSLLYFVMGRLLVADGQYRAALIALRRGLRCARGGAQDLRARIRPRIKLAIAGALLEAGELAPAAAALEEFGTELDEEPHPTLHTRRLEISAKLHLLKGELGAALEELKRVRDLCHQHGLYKGALSSSLNLARLLIHLNQTNAARRVLTRVRDLADASADADVRADASALLGLADERGRSASGGVSESPSLFNVPRGRDSAGAAGGGGRGGDHGPGRSEVVSYLARFELRTLDVYRLLGRRRFAAADALLRDLEEAFGLSDSALVRLRLRVLRAISDYYLGRLTGAEAALRELLGALREMGLTPELWQAQRVLGWCLVRLGRSGEERRALADDTQRLLTLIADSLPASHRAFFLLDKWTADEEYIAAQIDHLCHLRELLRGGPRLRRPARAWELMKGVNALLHHIDRYKDALAEGALEGREAKMTDEGGEGVPLWRRLLLHPLRRATVSFLVMPDRVLVTCAGWLFLNFEVLHTLRLAVRDDVQNWHLLVGRRGVRRNLKLPDDFKACAAREGFDAAAAGRDLIGRLSESLGLPSLLRALPRRVKALTIIPDDVLHGFPFAAASYAGKHLVESYALTLKFKTEEQARAADGGARLPALLVGVSEGVKRFVLPATGGEFEVSPLPSVRNEVNDLRDWFAGRGVKARELIDGAATKEAVLEGLGASRYVHIACHGFFAHERPDSSGLILIPEPGRAEILSLRELAGLRLDGLRHISLSSCSSADNFVLPGRWVISLPETLWRAGARSVLGCMWEVNDRFTASFMARFYWHLERHTREVALRRTQAECLRRAVESKDGGPRLDGGGVDTADPINWAAYSIYGEHGRLRFRSRARREGVRRWPFSTST